jgi:galactokinase
MNQSHDSLRDLFEVSSEPLNQLVALAREQQFVLGSRLTGAGFGGCTVSLLPTAEVSAFKRFVGPRYTEATGLTADFYTISSGAGVRQIALDASPRNVH